MKNLARGAAVLALTLYGTLACAQGAAATSIERLLEVMQMERMLQSAFKAMETMQQSQFDKLLADATKTDDEKKRLVDARDRVNRIVAEELSYAKIKPLYIETFGRVYTDDDVRNLITFYESPTGRKFIEKQPQLMQESFAAMQQRMQPIMQRIAREIEEANRR
jgi:hypothetical protein